MKIKLQAKTYELERILDNALHDGLQTGSKSTRKPEVI